MDKEFLKKHGLMESLKKFKMLSEYTFITNTLDEDEPEDGSNQQGNDGFPPAEGGNEDNGGMGGGNDMPSPEDNGGDFDGTPSQGKGGGQGSDNMDDVNPDNRQLGDTLDMDDKDSNNGEEDDDSEDLSPEQEGDEVIDVDDLTNSQEDTERKLDYTNAKIDKIIPMIDKFIKAIDQNDQKLDDLKREIELRNPTEVEKLNMRSQDSMPFNVSPKDYWEDKMKDSNYVVDFDNSVAPNREDMEYVIRKGDIANNSNLDAIAKTLDDEDMDQDIFKIFGISR